MGYSPWGHKASDYQTHDVETDLTDVCRVTDMLALLLRQKPRPG